jgi:hypothetical protein
MVPTPAYGMIAPEMRKNNQSGAIRRNKSQKPAVFW